MDAIHTRNNKQVMLKEVLPKKALMNSTSQNCSLHQGSGMTLIIILSRYSTLSDGPKAVGS